MVNKEKLKLILLEQKHKKNPMLLLLNGNSIRVNTRAEQWLCFSYSLSSARARAGHVFPDMSHTHTAQMCSGGAEGGRNET